MVMKFWFLEVCLVTTFLSIFSKQSKRKKQHLGESQVSSKAQKGFVKIPPHFREGRVSLTNTTKAKFRDVEILEPKWRTPWLT